jgi:hypothetical protein
MVNGTFIWHLDGSKRACVLTINNRLWRDKMSVGKRNSMALGDMYQWKVINCRVLQAVDFEASVITLQHHHSPKLAWQRAIHHSPKHWWILLHIYHIQGVIFSKITHLIHLRGAVYWCRCRCDFSDIVVVRSCRWCHCAHSGTMLLKDLRIHCCKDLRLKEMILLQSF